MRIFHAGMQLKVLLEYAKLYPAVKLDILKSFATRDHEIQRFCGDQRKKIGHLIFDSGTYSLNNSSQTPIGVNLSAYKAYLLQFGQQFDWYFNFDSDFSGGDSPENYQNQLELEGAGLKPVPVVHDIYGDEIQHFIDTGNKMVALGSSQITSMKVLAGVMERFASTEVKVHLLGNVSFDFISNFPIYSCDTSAHAQRGKYGLIYYWNPNNPVVDKTDKIYLDEYYSASKLKKITLFNYRHRDAFLGYLRNELGIAESNLYGDQGAFYKQVANLHHYVRLEQVVNQIHQMKGFIA
jgi:hypothetical protein